MTTYLLSIVCYFIKTCTDYTSPSRRHIYDNFLCITVDDLKCSYLAFFFCLGVFLVSSYPPLSELLYNFTILQLRGFVNELSEECTRLV